MPETVQDVINEALVEIRKMDAYGGTPADSTNSLCLKTLNRLLGQFTAQLKYAWTVDVITHIWPSSQQYQVIGRAAGADIDWDTPTGPPPGNGILRAFVIFNSGSTRRQIRLIDQAEFAMRRLQNQEGMGWYLFNDGAFPNSQLNFIFTPNDSDTTLELHIPKQLTEFTDYVTEIIMPPGYKEFLVSNLAERVAEPLGKTLTPTIVEMARRGRAAIAGSATGPSKIRSDAPSGSGGNTDYYGWLSGYYGR